MGSGAAARMEFNHPTRVKLESISNKEGDRQRSLNKFNKNLKQSPGAIHGIRTSINRMVSVITLSINLLVPNNTISGQQQDFRGKSTVWSLSVFC